MGSALSTGNLVIFPELKGPRKSARTAPYPSVRTFTYPLDITELVVIYFLGGDLSEHRQCWAIKLVPLFRLYQTKPFRMLNLRCQGLVRAPLFYARDNVTRSRAQALVSRTLPRSFSVQGRPRNSALLNRYVLSPQRRVGSAGCSLLPFSNVSGV